MIACYTPVNMRRCARQATNTNRCNSSGAGAHPRKDPSEMSELHTAVDIWRPSSGEEIVRADGGGVCGSIGVPERWLP